MYLPRIELHGRFTLAMAFEQICNWNTIAQDREILKFSARFRLLLTLYKSMLNDHFINTRPALNSCRHPPFLLPFLTRNVASHLFYCAMYAYHRLETLSIATLAYIWHIFWTRIESIGTEFSCGDTVHL